MERNFNIKAKADVETEFEKLSNEEQKAVVKALIWKILAHEYVEVNTEEYATLVLDEKVDISEEDVQKRRNELVDQAAKAIYSMVDVIFGDDEELKFRLFEKFVDCYGALESKIREKICDYNHNFSDWEEVTGERPKFDEDGDIECYHIGTYFMRQCQYCGKTEKAYSDYHKEKLEDDQKWWAKNHPKKFVYTRNNKNKGQL